MEPLGTNPCCIYEASAADNTRTPASFSTCWVLVDTPRGVPVKNPLLLLRHPCRVSLLMDYDRNDALLHWIFRQTQGDAWFRPNEEHISSGVALRISDGMCRSGIRDPQPINGHPAHLEGTPEFRVFPYENASLEPFEAAVSALNPLVAVKVRNAAVHAALAET